ncbi:MAG: peptide deformylase [Clostridiales bacterium]
MAVYQIIKDGDPVLREKAKPITAVNDAAVRLLNNLRDTLRETARGVGLAAPQIGISKRAFVIEIADEDIYYEMINPQIIKMEGREEGWEGCLSVPGVEGLVPRAEKLKVKYLNREGQECELLAEGYLARVIQHENDHLDGILFTDKTIAFNTDSEEEGE